MPRAPKTNRKNRSTKPQTLPSKFKAGFLESIDGRTELAKALRANYEAILEDLGAKYDGIGHVKSALIERFVWLECILQSIEHEMVNGQTDPKEAIGRWIQAVNSLSGLAKVLGIERKSSVRPWAMPALPSSQEEGAA